MTIDSLIRGEIQKSSVYGDALMASSPVTSRVRKRYLHLSIAFINYINGYVVVNKGAYFKVLNVLILI